VRQRAGHDLALEPPVDGEGLVDADFDGEGASAVLLAQKDELLGEVSVITRRDNSIGTSIAHLGWRKAFRNPRSLLVLF